MCLQNPPISHPGKRLDEVKDSEKREWVFYLPVLALFPSIISTGFWAARG
jgi:hypothetical protein